MWFDAAIDVIPAVDVLGDEAVRLQHGDYDDVVERADDPAELAARWVAAGAGRVHLVDLDGARSGRVRPSLVGAVAERIAPIPLQASGGIRALADAHALLDAGADRVVVGTAAWPDPTAWLELGEAVVLAIDVLDGELRTRGWTDGAGLSLAEAAARAPGARALVTAIDRDGTLAGPDLGLVAQAVEAGLRVLAAGGIRTPDDVDALAAAGAEAAVVGRALLYSPATSRRTKTR
jgi:phosphoribosylformimino-5-aminoimidazole carboxamide ribotide isomerase